jgi:MarR family transcriptional regulator, 2-MHQ and catechol-resistance regulon repressor
MPVTTETEERREAALKLWVVLARAHAAIEEHARAHAAQHGLTLPEFGVLEALHHKGRMLAGEVQRKILVSSGGVTYLVDRLVDKGLVERCDNPEDRRAKFVSLTRKGARFIERIFPEHAERLERALSSLTEEEQREAAALLRKLGRGAVALSGE